MQRYLIEVTHAEGLSLGAGTYEISFIAKKEFPSGATGMEVAVSYEGDFLAYNSSFTFFYFSAFGGGGWRGHGRGMGVSVGSDLLVSRTITIAKYKRKGDTYMLRDWSSFKPLF